MLYQNVIDIFINSSTMQFSDEPIHPMHRSDHSIFLKLIVLPINMGSINLILYQYWPNPDLDRFITTMHKSV